MNHQLLIWLQSQKFSCHLGRCILAVLEYDFAGEKIIGKDIAVTDNMSRSVFDNP